MALLKINKIILTGRKIQIKINVYLERLMRKGTLASCGLIFSKLARASYQQGQISGFLNEAFCCSRYIMFANSDGSGETAWRGYAGSPEHSLAFAVRLCYLNTLFLGLTQIYYDDYLF